MPSPSKYFATLATLVGVGCGTAAPQAERPAPGAPVPPAEAPGDPVEVRHVIFMVADGAGVAYWSAAAHARAELAFAKLPVVALVDTRSAKHRVPDSAATASGYATGELVTNRVVSMVGCPEPGPRDPVTPPPPGCEPVESWFELARSRGMATGAVTTTRVVDATPAAFVANSPNRYWYFEIAEQFAGANLEVILGGGRQYFDAAHRPDGADLIGRLCIHAACPTTAAELRAYVPDDRPLLGLFADDDMDSLTVEPVSLPAMTEVALARLARDPDGFVVLIETERTDNSGHENEPLDVITSDMLEFDDAVAVALRFARATPGTLLIVTADHETGGLALAETPSPDSLTAAYTTRGHTAAMVPLFAYGPGSERFAGVHRIADVGRLLKEIVGGR